MTKHEEIVFMLEKLIEDLDRSAIAADICRRRVFGYMQWLKENAPESEECCEKRPG